MQFAAAIGSDPAVDRHKAARLLQRSILCGIGGELVQDQTEGQRGAGPQEHLVAADPDVAAIARRIRLQGLLDQDPQRGHLPVDGRQQAVRRGQRLDAPAEGSGELIQRFGPGQSLVRDRQHRRERVLDPVAELGEQQVLLLLRPASFRNVPRDDRRPNENAISIGQRRDRDGYVEPLSVLGQPNRLKRRDGLAGVQALSGSGELVDAVWRHQHGNIATDRFRRRVAERSLCRSRSSS